MMSSLPFLLFLCVIGAIEGSSFLQSLGFIPGYVCTGSSTGLYGSCQTAEDCTSRGDVTDGACSLITTGICCISTLRCDSNAIYNNSYFASADYPNSTENASVCPLRTRLMWNVVYVKIELKVFDIIGPSENGNCNDDYLEIEGSTQKFPRICGKNTGQHLYIPVDQSTEATLTMKIVVSPKPYARKWLIKIVQIPANSPSLPPHGCLQYYSDFDGTVNSLNFDLDERVGGGNIAGMKYSVCFARHFGYCSVRLTTAYFRMNDTAISRRRREDEQVNIPFELYQQLMAQNEEFNRLHQNRTEETTTELIIPESTVGFIVNQCQNQDHVSMSPIHRQDIIPMFCGSSQRFSVRLIDEPYFIRVRNTGTTHGKGFSFLYKYLIC